MSGSRRGRGKRVLKQNGSSESKTKHSVLEVRPGPSGLAARPLTRSASQQQQKQQRAKKYFYFYQARYLKARRELCRVYKKCKDCPTCGNIFRNKVRTQRPLSHKQVMTQQQQQQPQQPQQQQPQQQQQLQPQQQQQQQPQQQQQLQPQQQQQWQQPQQQEWQQPQQQQQLQPQQQKQQLQQLWQQPQQQHLQQQRQQQEQQATNRRRSRKRIPNSQRDVRPVEGAMVVCAGPFGPWVPPPYGPLIPQFGPLVPQFGPLVPSGRPTPFVPPNLLYF